MIEILKKRRSIRKYKDKTIEGDKVDKLIKAALLSPTSRNLRPWSFIIVDDKNIIKKLSRAKDVGSEFLGGAPLAILVLADKELSDVWIEDSSIASIVIQLTAETLGLGSCWIQIRERNHNENLTAEDYIRDLFKLPANIKVESIIALGYPDEEKMPNKKENLKYDKIYRNKF